MMSSAAHCRHPVPLPSENSPPSRTKALTSAGSKDPSESCTLCHIRGKPSFVIFWGNGVVQKEGDALALAHCKKIELQRSGCGLIVCGTNSA